MTPLTVTSTYFGALATGDVPTAMAQLSPDVVWHQPGRNRFSGDHVGPDAVGAMVGGMHQVSGGTFAVAASAPMVNGDLVAYPVRFSARRDDLTMDMAGVDLLRVRDGKIVEVHLFSEDGDAEDRFWGLA